MRTQDIVISVLLHAALFAAIVIVSSTNSQAHQFNPDDIAAVQILDNIPMSRAKTAPEPVVEEPRESALPDLPDEFFKEESVEEEPVQLASIETPAKIAKKEKKKKKPKPKPKKDRPKQRESTDTGKTKKTIVSEGEVSTSIGIGDSEGQGGLGVGDFPYDIVRVIQMIDRNWDNPVLSQKSLKCVIYFQVDRDGSIKGVTVEESSGNSQYDMYALNAVLRTKELPPLPVSYKYDLLGFHVEFPYTP